MVAPVDAPLGELLVVMSDARDGARSSLLGAAPRRPDGSIGPRARCGRRDASSTSTSPAIRRSFTIPLDWGTSTGALRAQRVVDTLAREVPYGETVTYGELADMVGSPRAARAVGNVMAHCPMQILSAVPPGRWLGRTASVGTARRQLGMKRALLAIEGVHLHD